MTLLVSHQKAKLVFKKQLSALSQTIN